LLKKDDCVTMLEKSRILSLVNVLGRLVGDGEDSAALLSCLLGITSSGWLRRRFFSCEELTLSLSFITRANWRSFYCSM
jgi:hypothetical protein